MNSHSDTIVAPITAPGKAAVAVLRISGPKSHAISQAISPQLPESPKFRHAYYTSFVTGDDGLVLLFQGQNSFTGEDSAEFSIHGSPVSIKNLLEVCIQKGARMAEPGEFTQRALMNGKLDISQAEGVLATINSITQTQFDMANRLRSGGLLTQISDVREICLSALSTIEAHTDFSEELGDLNHELVASSIKSANQKVQSLLQTKEFVRITHQGASIAILGRPNAGKSSLLNALLNQERAIVTDIPGTTRDTVEEIIEFAGIPIKLIDTAGIRETQDTVETIGVERAMKAAQAADLTLYIYDAKIGWQTEDEETLNLLPKSHLVIANKSDLNSKPTHGIPISAKTKDGLQLLAEEISKRLIPEVPQDPIYLVDRHYQLLDEVAVILQETIITLKSTLAPDLASVQLRQAIRILGQISGDNPTADILHEIFSRFCLGK